MKPREWLELAGCCYPAIEEHYPIVQALIALSFKCRSPFWSFPQLYKPAMFRNLLQCHFALAHFARLHRFPLPKLAQPAYSAVGTS